MSPYQGLSPQAFWRTGVANAPDVLGGLYRKKFAISRSDKIATAGSCFAQHISRHLRRNGFNVLDLERAPAGLGAEAAARFGYGLYSARYGNIYSIRQLLQLTLEARGKFEPIDWIWEKDGRFYDALRPGVEPKGLSSTDEVRAHRVQHLAAVRRLLRRTNVLVFTFGLTEAWIHRTSGTVYPTAPGTIAGQYSSDIHAFKNFGFNDIYADFVKLRAILKRSQPELKFLITVSPVPLTATASGHHVLSATMYSKSVLRAAAGQLEATFDDVDYFPSFELIASHPTRSRHFEGNLRSIRESGVDTVMRAFLAEHAGDASIRMHDRPKKPVEDRVGQICEDILLESFS